MTTEERRPKTTEESPNRASNSVLPPVGLAGAAEPKNSATNMETRRSAVTARVFVISRYLLKLILYVSFLRLLSAEEMEEEESLTRSGLTQITR